MALSNSSMSFANSSAPGNYYLGSSLPSELPWYTYNYCNAPHVNAAHYELPKEKNVELVFVNVVQRHQKRTPDNLYPEENKFNSKPWDCDGSRLYNFAHGAGSAADLGSARIYHKTEVPDWHPLLSQIWNGTCDSGRLTTGGLRDSIQHGKDFWSVYGPQGKAAILKNGVNERDLYIRTSTEDRTFQVSGGLLHGMGYDGIFPVTAFPDNLDDLPPSYSCEVASNLRDTINAEDPYTSHINGQQSLFDQLNAVVGTGNISAWSSWIDHHFDAMASRQCNGHDLPRNPDTGARVSQSLANAAYAEGDWEYNYIWNTSPNADAYVRYSQGVFVQELARNLRAVLEGNMQQKVRYYVGHDGTMVRLLKTLAQSGQIRWPALGSEVVFEVWREKTRADSKSKQQQQLYVRILSYGRILYSDAPQLNGGINGTAEAAWVPLSNVVDYLQSRVPSDLAQRCLNG